MIWSALGNLRALEAVRLCSRGQDVGTIEPLRGPGRLAVFQKHQWDGVWTGNDVQAREYVGKRGVAIA